MKKLKKIFCIALLLVFLLSVGMIVHRQIQARAAQQSDEEAAALAGFDPVTIPSEAMPTGEATAPAAESTEPTEAEISPLETLIADPLAENLLNLDLSALRAVNPGVIGWLHIPDTNISYPLTQADNNDYYLNYTWDKQNNYRGAIFMECQSSPELTDFNTIIYGHNLVDGSMFSQLHEYKEAEFLSGHPYVYIVTDSGVYRYRVFAMFEVPTSATTFRIRFSGVDQKQAFLDSCVSWSVHDTGIVPTVDDHILTLSTCTGIIKTNRWVVQARLEGKLMPPDTLPGETP